MRAVKAIALICALLSLVCMVGAGFAAVQLTNSLMESAAVLNGLPAALQDVPPLEMMDYAQSYLASAAATLTDTVQESQLFIVVLFCAAVAFLLITLVLLIALRPGRRGYDY